jgi:hypothetical protein
MMPMKKPRPREPQPTLGVMCRNCHRRVMFLKLDLDGHVMAVLAESVEPGQEWYDPAHGQIRHDRLCQTLNI